ncbi:163_t:CDS:1, partial [Racocetra persica]
PDVLLGNAASGCKAISSMYLVLLFAYYYAWVKLENSGMYDFI